MKIRVLSDLHFEMGGHEPPHVDSDLVILAGDTGKKRIGLDWALSLPDSTPVLYLMGNHEYYGAKIPNQLAVDYRVGSTRILSNPSGYPDESIKGFDPCLLIDTASLLGESPK